MPKLSASLNQLLSIQEAAAFLRVSEKTLRRWEDRGMLTPIRTSGGHRRYPINLLKEFKKQPKKRRSYTLSTPALSPVDFVPDSLDYHPEASQEPNYPASPSASESKQLPQHPADIFSQLLEEKKTTTGVLLSATRKQRSGRKSFFLYGPAVVIIILLSSVILSSSGNYFSAKFPRISSLLHSAKINKNNQNDNSAIDTLKTQIIEESQKESQVLAATSYQNIQFLMNVESIFKANSSFLNNVSINNDLDVGGNTSISANLAVNGGNITSTAAAANIFNDNILNLNIGGAATALSLGATSGTTTINNNVIAANDLTVNNNAAITNDLTVTGDATVKATAYLTTLTMNGDTITDITGSGLSVSGGALTATLGTSIDSSEITDATIKAVDLNASNSPLNNQSLSYNSSTGGFTWRTAGADIWTEDLTTAYLTHTNIDLAVGGTDSTAPLYMEAATGNIATSGDLAVNGGDITSTATSLVINAGGNIDMRDIVNVDSLTTDTGGITIVNGKDLTIGLIGLKDTGLSANTSGASLIGVYDEFSNSNSTTVQGVLNDFDSLITGGGIGTITALGDVSAGDAFTQSGNQGTSLYFYDPNGHGHLTIANITQDQTYTLPDATGTICLDTGNCLSSGIWTAPDGAYVQTFPSFDVLLGGTTTASAKFAFLNNLGGVPTASVAGTTGALSLSAAGNILTTNMQNLSLGSPTTGKIVLDSGTGNITLSDNTSITGTLTTDNTVTFSNLDADNFVRTTTGGQLTTAQYVDLTSQVNNLLSLTNGGTGVDLSTASTGGIIYKDTTSLNATGALTGMLKGNGSSAPSTVTSITNYVTFWTDNNTISGEQYLSTSRGGTGLNASAAANGMLLIGNSSGLSLGYLTPGAGMTISSGSGAITIAHSDTSEAATTTNTGANVVQNITLDTFGHITEVTATDLSADLSTIFDNYQYWTISDGTNSGNVSSKNTATFSGTTGTGIAVSYNGTDKILSIAGIDATTSSKGVAYFSDSFFNVTSGAVTIANDSLNFAQFADSLALDASTNIDLGSYELSTSGTGTLDFASTGQVSFAGNLDAADGLDVSGDSLTVGANAAITTTGEISGTKLSLDYLTLDDRTLSSASGISLTLTSAEELLLNDKRASSIQLSKDDATLPAGNIALIDAINDAYNAATGGSGSFWKHIDHILFPSDSVDDLIIGGNSSISAKFRIASSGSLDSSNNAISWTLADAANSLNIDANTLVVDAHNHRVGIGMNNPSSALDVDGDIKLENSHNLVVNGDNIQDLTGNGLKISSNVLTAALLSSAVTDGATKSSYSGLEFTGTAANEIGLLQGCASDEILKWDSTNHLWKCSADAGSGTGSSKWAEVDSFLYPINGLADIVGIGSTTASDFIGKFNVTGSRIGRALTVLNETSGNEDILTASSSGATVMLLDKSGNLGITGNLANLTGNDLTIADNTIITGSLTVQGNTLGLNNDADTDNILAYGSANKAAGAAGDDLYWGDKLVCDSALSDCGWATAVSVATDNPWTTTDGIAYLKNSTLDLFVGGDSSTSAKFALLNMSGGIPTASIAGNLTLNSNGTIGTTRSQSLTLGGSTTGQINITAQGKLIFNQGGLDQAVPLASSAGQLATTSKALIDSINEVYADVTGTGTAGVWRISSGVINPTTDTNSLALHGTDSSAPLYYDAGSDVLTLTQQDTAPILNVLGAIHLGASDVDNVLNTTSTGVGNDPSGRLYWGNNEVCDKSGNCSGTGAGIGGSGSQYQIARFSGTYNLENSSLFDNGETTGIGTLSPDSRLTVSGGYGGNALVTLNETFGNNIISASASGTTVANLTRSGDFELLTQGDLRLYDADNSRYTGFQAPAALGSTVIYSLPTDDGSANQILITDGSGNLSWVDETSTAGNTWLHADHAVYPTHFWSDDLLLGGNSTGTAAFRISAAGGIDTANTNNAAWTLANAVNALNFDSNTFTIDAFNNRIGIGSANPTATLHIYGDMRLTAGFYDKANTRGTSGQVLASWNDGDPVNPVYGVQWIDPANLGTNYWNLSADGVLSPKALYNSLNLGTAATSSAAVHLAGTNGENSFINNNAFFGIGTNSPLAALDVNGDATISGDITLNSVAAIQTTNNQNLTIGGSTTGNINLTPLANAGLVTVDGNLTVTAGKILTFNSDVFDDLTGAGLERTSGSDLAVKLYTADAGSGSVNSASGLEVGSDGLSLLRGCDNGYILKWEDASNSWKCAVDAGSGTGSSKWTETDSYLFPNNAVDSVGIGSNNEADFVGKFTVSGTKLGYALAVFNDTGSDQNIITASASGTTVMNLDRSGNMQIEGSLSDLTDASLTINDNAIVTGTLSVQGTTLGLDNDGHTYNLLGTASTGGSNQAGTSLYWGNDLLCDPAQTNCGWATQAGTETGNPWDTTTTPGTLFAKNGTLDLILGGNSTGSAKFAVLNMTGSNPTTASVSGTAGATYLTASGTLTTTNMQNLNIGGPTAADINLLNNTYITSGSDLHLGTIGLTDTGSSNTTSGASLLGINDDDFVYITSSTVQGALKDLDSTINTISGGALSGSGTDNYLARWNGSGSLQASLLYQSDNNALAIGTESPASLFHINGSFTGNALVTFNETGSNDILTASNSGTTRMTLNANGQLSLNTTGVNGGLIIGGDTALYRSAGDTLYTPDSLSVTGTLTGTGPISFDPSGAGTITLTADQASGSYIDITGLAAGDGSGLCVDSSNHVITCNPGSGGSLWTIPTNTGSYAQKYTSADLLIGGNSTASAKFAALNMVGSGIPTASVSGTAGAAYLTAGGNLAATNMQNITIGGTTTGDIQLKPNDQTGLFLNTSGNIGMGTTSLNDFVTILQSSVTGSALDISRNLAAASTDSPLMNISQTNSGDDQNAVNIANNGTGIGLYINQGTTGINQALSIYSNVNASANSPLVSLNADNNAFDNNVFSISNDGTGAGINLDSSNTGDLMTLTATGALTTANGIVISSSNASGVITDALDVSDAEIVNALNLGQNSILASGSFTIDLANAGADTLTITNSQSGAGIASLAVEGNVTVSGTQLALNPGGDADNILSTASLGAGHEAGNLYWGNALLCTAANPNCGWASSASDLWYIPTNTGSYAQKYTTSDLFIGGNSTASAKFSILNMANGTPTASLSGTNSALVMNGNGNITTTRRQTLTLGGGTTGPVTIDAGTGIITLSDDTTLNGVLTLPNSNTLTGIDTGATKYVRFNNGLEVGGNSSYTFSSGGALQADTLTTLHETAGEADITSGADSNLTLIAAGSGIIELRDTTQVFNNLTLGDSGTGYGSGLYFYQEQSDPTCNSGDYFIFAKNNVLRKCQNGTVTDLDTTGGLAQYWQLSAQNVLSPFYSGNDLAIGGTSTSTAKFAVLNMLGNNTPTASVSAGTAGAAYLTAAGTLATTNSQKLTLGSAATGPIDIDSGTGSITLKDNSVIEGTLTLPNTNTLTGLNNYLQLNNGLAVGGSTTYSFTSAGVLNGDQVILSNATTDITTGSNQDLTLLANGTGLVNVNDTLAVTNQLQIGNSTTAVGYSRFGTNTTDHSLSTNADTLFSGNVEIDGTLYLDGGFNNGLTQGSVVFAGSSQNFAQDNANFYWNDSTDRLGLGTSAPGAMLDVRGTASLSGNLTLAGSRTIGGINMEPLTFGGANTGLIYITNTGSQNITLNAGGQLIFNQGTALTQPVPLASSAAQLSTTAKAIVDAINEVYGEVMGNGANGLWKLTDSIIHPNTTGHDLAIGGNSSNAPFYFDSANERLNITNTKAGNSLVVNDQATDTTPFVIDQSGNVGIQNAAPLAALDVGGSASVSGNLTFYGGARNIQSTQSQNLTIGGDTTGNIFFNDLRTRTVGAIPLTNNATRLIPPLTNGIIDAINDVYSYATGGQGQSGYFERIADDLIFPHYPADAFALGGNSSASAGIVLNPTGSAVFNEQGLAAGDVRIEGDTDPYLFFSDASADAITVGSNNTLAKLGIDGTADIVQLLAQANASQTSNIFVVEQSNGTDIFSIGNTGNTTLTNSGTSGINFNLAGTGDFAIQDNGTTFFTFTNDSKLTQTGNGQVTLTGNVDATAGLDISGANLTVGGTKFNVTTAGVVTADGSITTNSDIAVNGGDITSTAALTMHAVNDVSLDTGSNNIYLKGSGATFATIASSSGDMNLTIAGGDLNLADTNLLHIGGLTGVSYNSIANSSDTLNHTGAINSDNDLFIGGDLEVAGNIYQGTYAVCTAVGNCEGSAIGYWNQTDDLGILYPKLPYVDLLIGGNTTASAKFAVLNMGGAPGTVPTASVSAEAGSTYLTANGLIATTNMQKLTLGGATTGAVDIDAGTGSITLKDNTDATAGLDVTGGNFTVGSGSTYLTVNYNNGDIVTSGDLTLNGGDLIASASGTINIANAASIINLGSTNQGRTVNIGTGTGGDLINIGTSSTGTNDTIAIGNTISNTTLALTGGSAWSVTSAGTATLTQAKVDYLNLDYNTITVTNGAGNNNLWLDAYGTGDVNIAATSSGNINLAGGSSATGCTINNNNGNITCSGNYTGANGEYLNNAVNDQIAFYDESNNLLAAIYDKGTNGVLFAAGGISTYNNAVNAAGYVEAKGFCLGDDANCISSWSSAGVSSNWNLNGSALAPADNGWDVLIGNSATASAKFAFMNVRAGVPTASIAGQTSGATYLTGDGALATTQMKNLTIGGDTTGDITINPRAQGGTLSLLGAFSLTGSIDDSNSASLTINDGLILGAVGAGIDFTAAGNHLITASAGTLQLGAVSLTGQVSVAQDMDIIPAGTTGTNDLGASGTPWDNIYANTIYQNGVQVCDTTTCGAAAGYWAYNTGALYPAASYINSDLLLGATATTSAKFAFMNVNGSGTPTASIAGNLVLGSTTNSIQSTARRALNIGGDTTGTIALKPGTGILDLTTQATNIDLINTNASALNFESGLLKLDTQNTAVSITGLTKLGDGGTTNYAQFSTTGALTFNGTASTLTFAATNPSIVIGDTGTLAFTDGGTNLLTIKDDNTSGGSILYNRPITGSAPTCSVAGTIYTSSTKIWYCNGSAWIDLTDTGPVNFWQYNAGAISPASLTTEINLANVATDSAKVSLAGSLSRGKAVAIFNQTELGQDIIAASASGTKAMSVDRSGNLTLYSTTANADNIVIQPKNSGSARFNGIITSADITTADKTWTFPDATGTVCLSTGNCSSVGNLWQENTKVLSPYNSTLDLAVGGTSTDSATFQVMALSGNATMSGTLTLNSAGSIQTTRMQGLTLGGNTTGDISLSPRSGAAGSTLDINALTMDIASQATDIELKDNTANALTISQGTNNYLTITTTDNNEALTLDLPTGGATSLTANLFTSNIAKTIYLGTGTAVDTIHIGDGATGADVISIGSTNAGAVTLKGGANSLIDFPNFDVATSGNITVASTQGLDTNAAAGTLNLGAANATNISLGNSTAATNINLNVGSSGNIVLKRNGTAIDCSGQANGGALTTDASGNLICSADDGGSGTTQLWTTSNGTLYPTNLFMDVNLGATATDSAKVSLAGSYNRGKAVAIFNQTETQDILAASASGTNVWRLGRTGDMTLTDSGTANVDFNLSSTGDMTISDAGTNFWTFADDKNVSYNGLNTAGMTLTSSLTGGSRSTGLFSLSQANNASNDFTGSLMSVTNNDTASSGDILSITNSSTNANSAAISLSAPAGNAVGIDMPGQNMSGAAIGIKLGSATTGTGFSDFSGAYLDISPSKTYTGTATPIAESGNLIRASRYIGVNNGSNPTYNVSGDVVSLASNCAPVAGNGTCNDSSNILSLTQSYTSATGAVLDITSSGLGSLINADGASKGKALVVLNQTAAQDIFTASSSGTTRFTIANDGSLTAAATDTTTNAFTFNADLLTQGLGVDLSADVLTTGYALNLTSTSNALSSGRLANFDWSPTLPTTASGDLVRLNIGANGDITGNLFNITDGGSSIFRVSSSQMESTVPADFSAAGDVSVANDMVMTNQTSNNIKTYGPLNIESGESFENNNLTLKTYGTGNAVFDMGTSGTIMALNTYSATVGATNRDLYIDNTGKVGYVSSSLRYKENINNLNSIDWLYNLRPVSFSYISDPNHGTQYGLIAEEVDKINPLLVSYDAAGQPETVSYNKLISPLLSAVQQQEQDLTTVKDQINSLTDGGDLQTVADSSRDDYYRLVHKDNTTVNNLSLNGLVSSTIEALQASVDTMLVKVGLVSPEVLTNNIKPTQGNKDVKIAIGDQGSVNSDQSGFGKLLIQDRNGNTVASIDEAGNSTFSGELTSAGLRVTGSASIAGEIHAGTIYADQVISRNGTFADTQTASISGITREEIEKILAEAKIDQGLLNQSTNWNTATATDSASLSQPLASLTASELFVTGTAAVTNLSASNSLTVGPDLIISSLTTNNQPLSAIDSLTAPMSFQSSASQPLYFMGGLIVMDTHGNLRVNGDLAVAGEISSSSLVLSESTEDSGFGKLLRVQNLNGVETASIDASGSAKFTSVSTNSLTLTDDPAATTAATFDGIIMTSNATAGKGVIPSEAKEITIINSRIKANSLVYVTPTSSTGNLTLYVKEQQEGKVVIGMDATAADNIGFNWWVIGISDNNNQPL